MLSFDAGGEPLIALVKLEYEEGTRALLTGKTGHKYYRIEHVVDLMLTRKTKLFKVAMFRMPSGGATIADIEGRTCDYQAGPGIIAGYFLHDFLACEQVGQNDLFTEAFLDAAELFINHRVPDPATKARYESAVLAELHSTTASINPLAFARRSLDADHRQPFLDILEERDVPSSAFGKDTSLVRRRIERLAFHFGEKNITLTTPREEIGQAVTIEADGETTQVHVRGKLTSTKGSK
jgi:hypothetical protein